VQYGEASLNIRCVSNFSTALVRNILIISRIQLDIIINVPRSLFKVPVLDRFYETYICQHTFEKFSNLKFHVNPTGVSRVASGGRADR
jgi:hypothetical protein